MPIRLSLFLLFLLAPIAANAMPLAPHRAVYDLQLASQSSDLVGAEGRIVMVLKSDTCAAWNLDYRFVARFQQDQEMTVTDQRTTSTESQTGDAFAFTTKTFVDGAPEKEVRGDAKHERGATKVVMQAPERKSFDLPLSRFPMQHTQELIQRAKAGDRIFETKLFDGDDDAQKLLTSTALIVPNDVTPAPISGVEGKLAGIASWRISESYYNSDSDLDGMPVFQTKYVLYENGVSDRLTLDFGTYVFTGRLKTLDFFERPDCR